MTWHRWEMNTICIIRHSQFTSSLWKKIVAFWMWVPHQNRAVGRWYSWLTIQHMSHYICHKAKFTKLTNASTQHSANMPPYKQNCFIVQIWMLFSVSVYKRNTILEQGSDWILKLKNSYWRPALVSFFFSFFPCISFLYYFIHETKQRSRQKVAFKSNKI
jgi:hypothetical protein